MLSLDGNFVISYNGEIYNYLEIKKSEVEGYKFVSNTDTEVVLNALICWGTDAILKFNGMFTFLF